VVGRVASAGYIGCDGTVDVVGNLDESIDMQENFVDSMVAMPANLPSFDNSCVVAIYDEVLWVVEDSLKSMK